MKICPKCNSGNDANALQCKDCGCSISKVSANSLEDYIQQKEKKHRRKMLIQNTILLIVGIFYIYFLIRGLQVEFSLEILFAGILLPFLAYMGIYRPRAIFVMNHFLTIDNIDDVELSSLYVFCSKVGGYLCTIIAFAFVVAFYIMG